MVCNPHMYKGPGPASSLHEPLITCLLFLPLPLAAQHASCKSLFASYQLPWPRLFLSNKMLTLFLKSLAQWGHESACRAPGLAPVEVRVGKAGGKFSTRRL